MADQEQTEGGASMISGSVTWTPYDETIRQLRADLERVTAERDELRAENERLKNVEIVSLEAEVVAHVDEIERLRAALREIYGHATANNDGQPCCDTVVMLAKAALHPTPA